MWIESFALKVASQTVIERSRVLTESSKNWPSCIITCVLAVNRVKNRYRIYYKTQKFLSEWLAKLFIEKLKRMIIDRLTHSLMLQHGSFARWQEDITTKLTCRHNQRVLPYYTIQLISQRCLSCSYRLSHRSMFQPIHDHIYWLCSASAQQSDQWELGTSGKQWVMSSVILVYSLCKYECTVTPGAKHCTAQSQSE